MKSQLEKLLGRRLQDAGENWKCECVFHDEKSASFYIEKEGEHRAHCFGCGIGGSIEFLVAKYLSISLAEGRAKLGIVLGERLQHSSKGVEPARKRLAFPESWLAPWPRIKESPYLKSRGFCEESYQVLESRWDKSNKRVVFPLRNLDGALVGAVGRATDNRERKWYFYWGCRAHHSIYLPTPTGESTLVVVEGIADLMRCYQAGFQNVCALLTASATAHQLAEIMLTADTVILCLDSDSAGERGTKALHKALRGSCKVYFTQLPKDTKDIGELTDQVAYDVLNNPLTIIEKYYEIDCRNACI